MVVRRKIPKDLERFILEGVDPNISSLPLKKRSPSRAKLDTTLKLEPNPECRRCSLHETAQSVCIPGESIGPDSSIMIVGQAPGWEEDKRGRPFVGKSGRLLREELARVGINSYYITNPVKCMPPGDRKPTNEEIKACRPYLEAELERIKPKYLVTAGALPSKLLLKESKITQAHGKVKPMNNWIGYPIFHPAYILRDPGHLPTFRHDLERLVREIRGEKPKQDIEWEIVTRENQSKFLKEFTVAPEFAFDTETTSLFPHDRNGGIRCLAIALEKRTWVIPGQMPSYDASLLAPIVKTLVQIQWSTEKVAIAQNGKFDNEWLWIYCGVKFFLDFDTMLAHHILDENSDHDLKYLARSYLDVPEYDISKKEKENPDLSTPGKRRAYMEYNAKDATYNLLLKRVFQKQLQRNFRLRRLFYFITMPAARAMEEIELEGMSFDPERYIEVEADIRIKHRAAERKLNNSAGRIINWNSPPQIRGLLFNDLKLPITEKTPTGEASTGELALINIHDKHPIVKELLKYRELEKFQSSYIEGWKPYIVGERLYFSYKIHGTVTGRYSSRLHQVPRDGTLRNIFTAPPGWNFAQADLSQAELRIAAELSGDLELRACFRPGGPDVHWRTALHTIGSGATGKYNQLAIKTANRLIDVDGPWQEIRLTDALETLRDAGHEKATSIDKIWKEARYQAKPTNFGFVFGMYENTYIEQCKTEYGFEPTWKEAHDTRTAYFELYSGIHKWQERQKTLVRLDGQVTNLFGRVRRLPAISSSDRSLRSDAERQAINSPVQGTIGDWKAAALIEIHETIDRKKLKIVGEHHDALLMVVKEGCEDEVLPRVREIMRKPKLLEKFKINMSVEMDSEIQIGNWGEGKTYHG